MGSKLLASLARTAASVFIGGHRCLPFSLPVSSPRLWRVFQPPGPESVVGRRPTSRRRLRQSIGSGAGAFKPGLLPAALAVLAHRAHRARRHRRPPAPGRHLPSPPRHRAGADRRQASSTGCRPGSTSAGVRADVPPIPGSDAARTSPAPEPAPDPPASGWFDIGLAPIRPIWRLVGPEAAAHLAEHLRHLLQRLGQLLQWLRDHLTAAEATARPSSRPATPSA